MDDTARQSDDMIEEEVDNEGQLELDLPDEEEKVEILNEMK
jgi:hypothetical protein